MAALERHPEAGLCFSQLAIFTDGTDVTFRYDGGPLSGAAFDYRSFPEFITPEFLFDTLKNHYVWISGNTVVANRRMLLQSGAFPPELKWHSDWFGFYVLALRHGACVIPETLAMMRETATSYSREGLRDKQEQFRTLDAIMRTIESSRYADVGYIFMQRPTLFSVFGRDVVRVAWRRRHFRIALGVTGYYFNRGSRKLCRMIRAISASSST